MQFHHLGVAVRDLDQGIAIQQQVFGHRLLSGPFDDPIQRVRVCFVGTGQAHEIPFELVAPLGDDSPIGSVLKRKLGAYHVCYEVADFDETLDVICSKGCLLLSGPDPAVAFSGRRIAWCCTPSQQLVEILSST